MVHLGFYTRVVGLKFHELAIDRAHDIELKREPTNSVDPNALVLYDVVAGGSVAYILKKVSTFLSPLLDDGLIQLSVSWPSPKESSSTESERRVSEFVRVDCTRLCAVPPSRKHFRLLRDLEYYAANEGSDEAYISRAYEKRYASRFKRVLEAIVERYSHILDDDERSFVDRFLSFPDGGDEQRLYARLFSRKKAWIDISTLDSYVEVSDMKHAVERLRSESLLDVSSDSSQVLESLMGDVKRDTLKEFVRQARVSLDDKSVAALRKADLVKSILTSLRSQRGLDGQPLIASKRVVDKFHSVFGTWVRLSSEARTAFRRCYLLFYLNFDREKEPSAEIMEAMGRVNFYKYELSQNDSIFPSRGVFLAYDKACSMLHDFEVAVEDEDEAKALNFVEMARIELAPLCSKENSLSDALDRASSVSLTSSAHKPLASIFTKRSRSSPCLSSTTKVAKSEVSSSSSTQKNSQNSKEDSTTADPVQGTENTARKPRDKRKRTSEANSNSVSRSSSFLRSFVQVSKRRKRSDSTTAVVKEEVVEATVVSVSRSISSPLLAQPSNMVSTPRSESQVTTSIRKPRKRRLKRRKSSMSSDAQSHVIVIDDDDDPPLSNGAQKSRKISTASSPSNGVVSANGSPHPVASVSVANTPVLPIVPTRESPDDDLNGSQAPRRISDTSPPTSAINTSASNAAGVSFDISDTRPHLVASATVANTPAHPIVSTSVPSHDRNGCQTPHRISDTSPSTSAGNGRLHNGSTASCASFDIPDTSPPSQTPGTASSSSAAPNGAKCSSSQWSGEPLKSETHTCDIERPVLHPPIPCDDKAQHSQLFSSSSSSSASASSCTSTSSRLKSEARSKTPWNSSESVAAGSGERAAALSSRTSHSPKSEVRTKTSPNCSNVSLHTSERAAVTVPSRTSHSSKYAAPTKTPADSSRNSSNNLQSLHTSHIESFVSVYRDTAVFAEICHEGTKLLEQRHRFRAANTLLLALLDCRPNSRRRGYWYTRLAINFEKHTGQTRRAFDLCVRSLSDPLVDWGDLLDLRARAYRLWTTKFPNHRSPFAPKVLNSLKYPFIWPKLTIHGRPLNKVTGEKSRFIGYDDDVCSVEELVIQYYALKSKGSWRGVHCEGSVFRTLYGLLMWDCIFANVPNAFHTRYQAGPLDAGTRWFYPARKAMIDARFHHLASLSNSDLSAEVSNTWHEHHGTSCLSVRWDKFECAELCEIASCCGGKVLVGIFRRFAVHSSGGGMPDLCLWRISGQSEKKGEMRGDLQLVEVKGPRDRLSNKQKCWLEYLHRVGVSVRVCLVKEDRHELQDDIVLD